MMYRSGRFGSRGRGGGMGLWPGNGPFSHLPPWERPGWVYGPGSCWTLGLRTGTYQPLTTQTALDSAGQIKILEQQKKSLEVQLNSLKETLQAITERLEQLEKGNE